MRKIILRTIISTVIIWGNIPSLGFCYLEKKVYCQINQEKIAISLKSEDGQLCTELSQQIEIAMKKTYKEIVTIQNYINTNQDIDYRTPLRDKRVDWLKKLQEVRLNILAHIKTFEKNLVGKAKTYFLKSISQYETRLRYTMLALAELPISDSRTKYEGRINAQLENINNIAGVENFEELDNTIQKYIYLKAKIEGK